VVGCVFFFFFFFKNSLQSKDEQLVAKGTRNKQAVLLQMKDKSLFSTGPAWPRPGRSDQPLLSRKLKLNLNLKLLREVDKFKLCSVHWQQSSFNFQLHLSAPPGLRSCHSSWCALPATIDGYQMPGCRDIATCYNLNLKSIQVR